MSLFTKLPFGKNISFKEVKISNKLKKTLKEEEKILQTFSSVKRQLEFRAGRIAAHIALKKLQNKPSFPNKSSLPLLRGSKGEVLWPELLTGSISHSNEYAVAIVCKKTDFSALGIDIEYTKKDINDSIYNRVLSQGELESIKKNHYLTCFSAKEAIYKAVYSKTQLSLGWQDISLFFTDKNELYANIKKESFNIQRQEVFITTAEDYTMTSVFLK